MCSVVTYIYDNYVSNYKQVNRTWHHMSNASSHFEIEFYALTVLSPHQLLTYSPTNGMRKRIRRVKVRKLVGWDKDSLTGKAKAVCTSKAKQRIHSPLPMDRQVFSHLQERRAPSHVTVTGEDKHHHSKFPPPFPQLYTLSMTPHSMECPFGQLGSAVPAVSPPNSLCTPSLLTGEGGWEAEKALALCKHCPIINTVSSTNPKQSPVSATMKKTNSIPAKSSTACYLDITWWVKGA